MILFQQTQFVKALVGGNLLKSRDGER
jgi:hypothetical protein